MQEVSANAENRAVWHSVDAASPNQKHGVQQHCSANESYLPTFDLQLSYIPSMPGPGPVVKRLAANVSEGAGSLGRENVAKTELLPSFV